MERAGAHLHVVRLQDHAALLGPVFLQREDQVLEGAGRCAEGIGQVRVLTGAQYSGAPPKTTANSASLITGPYRLTTRISYTSEMALPSHA